MHSAASLNSSSRQHHSNLTPKRQQQQPCCLHSSSRSTSTTTKHQQQHTASLRAAVIAAAAARAAVGIDLGTTNSVVAVLREGEERPTVIRDSSGAFTIPSVVAYSSSSNSTADQQRPLVGAAAKQQASANPLNTFYSVKRLVGRSCQEVQGLGLVYQLQQPSSTSVGAGDGGVELVCPARGVNLTPEQVSAEVLRHLLDLATQHLAGHTPQQVVITVPAYFNAQQRTATLEAARLAGIQQVSLLQEPVAAALAFGFGKPYEAETLLVFDLGGGTFDLSVVDSFEGIMEVLATGGDALLGGDDFDRELLQGLLADMSKGQQGQANSSSSSQLGPDTLAALLEAVEAAKCQLSTQESVEIPVSSATAAQLGVSSQLPSQQPRLEQQLEQQSEQQQQQQAAMVTLQLTRQRMHELTAGLRHKLWRPLQPLAEACKLQYACDPSSIEQQLQQQQQQGQQQQQPAAAAADNNTSNGSSNSADRYAPKPRQLSAVLLVGGATRMPIIQHGLQVLTGLTPRSEVDPEQAVALGAAIQAAVLTGISSGVELMDGSYVEEFHDRSTGF